MLAFLDTETTGTNPAIHDIWEIAVVLESDGHIVADYTALVRPADLGMADSAALQIGGYYERTPNETNDIAFQDTAKVARELATMLSGAVIVGNNVTFDVEFVRSFLYANDLAPAWHYSPVDVKAFCAGLLGVEPPWSTDELLRLMDIDPEKLGLDRHTARGDVEISRMMYHMALVDRRTVLKMREFAGWMPPAAAIVEEVEEDHG